MSDGWGRGGPFSHLPTEQDYKERVKYLTDKLDTVLSKMAELPQPKNGQTLGEYGNDIRDWADNVRRAAKDE